MKNIILIVLLCFSNYAFSQFAKIVDADGYVNLRAGAGIKSKIIGRINSGDFVFIYSNNFDKDKWVDVKYPNGDNIIRGYIHKSRLRLLSSYTKIPFTQKKNNFFYFFNKDLELGLAVGIEKFNIQKHISKFTIVKDGNMTVFEKYNGKTVYGIDIESPYSNYISIKAKFGSKIIQIPREDFENLFNANEGDLYMKVNYDVDTNSLYFTSSNSDGYLSYNLLYVIKKDGSFTRKIVPLN